MKIKLIKFVDNPFAILMRKKSEIIEKICLACYYSFNFSAGVGDCNVYASCTKEKANRI